MSMLFAIVAFVLPLLTNNRSTLAVLVPAGRTLTSEIYAPLDPAVKMVNTVPVPSLAVFAVLSGPADPPLPSAAPH